MYEEVNAWYTDMEKVPAYACCVQGDARHWRKCLEHVIPLHNENAASEDEKVQGLPSVSDKFGWWMMNKNSKSNNEIWKQYADSEVRPWLADTPMGEVALYLMRNHQEIVQFAAAKDDLSMDDSAVDTALREVIQLLLEDGENANELSENGQAMAKYASETIEIPRDLGMIPALALGELVQSMQTFAA